MKRFAWEALLVGALAMTALGCNSSMYHVMDDVPCYTNTCTSCSE